MAVGGGGGSLRGALLAELPSAAPPAALLLPGGGGAGLWLAQQGSDRLRQQEQRRGRSRAPRHHLQRLFLQPDTSLQSEAPAPARLLPRRGAPEPACPRSQGSRCPSALTGCSPRQLWWDCGRRGLRSWMLPWPQGLGTGLGTFPRVAERNQGLSWDLGNGSRESAVPGLLLGRAVAWLQPRCLSAGTHGHLAGQGPELQHPGGGTHAGAGR